MDQLNSEIAQVKENLSKEAKTIAEGGGEVLDPIAQLAKYGDEQLSLNIEIETMRAREKAFQKVIGSYDATLSHLPEQELTLARLTRERDVNRRIFDNLLEKLENTKISEAENVPSVRIVDSAVPDPDPIHPRKTVNLAVGLFLGLIAGTGIALVRESSVSTMESVQELEETTGWPALATLPSHPVPEGELPVGGGEPLIGERQVRARKRSLITLLEPGSGPSEAYRMLRTNLKFRGVGDGIRTVAITSTEPNEGKTTIVANLAISFATMGDRVLVLDAEIRRAGMHEIFGVPLRPGLSDLISVRALSEKSATKIAVGHGFGREQQAMISPEGIEYDSSRSDVPIRVAIHPTAIRNLSVLPAGTTPENPADALASHVEALRRVFDAVKNDFDVILIDTPPLAIVHDTAILAQFVDVVMFVVNSRRIDRELLMRSRSVLERSGANVVGTVLNQVEPIGTYKTNPYYYRARSSGVSRK
jgi:Mrp family chromosome partitioning ATPase